MSDDGNDGNDRLWTSVVEYTESTDLHPLWQGLLLILPVEGRSWPQERRDRWLEMARLVCESLYPEDGIIGSQAEVARFAEEAERARRDCDAMLDERDQLTEEIGRQAAAIRELQDALNARDEAAAAPDADLLASAREAKERVSELARQVAEREQTIRELQEANALLERQLPESEVATVELPNGSALAECAERLVRVAAEGAGEPEAADAVLNGASSEVVKEEPPQLTVESRTLPGVMVAAKPCRVDDCDGLAPRAGGGRLHGICAADIADLKAGATVLIGGAEHRLEHDHRNNAMLVAAVPGA